MGRLAGFRYGEIVRKLKVFGFECDRQPAGSHEIWFCIDQPVRHRPQSSWRCTRGNAPGDSEAGSGRPGSILAGLKCQLCRQRAQTLNKVLEVERVLLPRLACVRTSTEQQGFARPPPLRYHKTLRL